jgi:hypothetical protein
MIDVRGDDGDALDPRQIGDECLRHAVGDVSCDPSPERFVSGRTAIA